MRFTTLFIGVLIAFVSAQSIAQSPTPNASKPMSKEDLEKMEQLDKAMGALDKLQVTLEATLKERKYKCLKAFGNDAFCSCLNDKLAVGLGFDGYVFVVTKTKEDLKYSQMSKDDKALVDSAVRTREQCVK